MAGSWAYIQFVERPGRPGGPVDPGYGIEGGLYPDQGLPGGDGWSGLPPHPGNRPPGSFPGRPDQGLPWPGRPVDPGYGVGSEYPDQGLPGYPGRPGHGLPRPPRPPHVWPRPPGGGLPVDPGWGVDSGVEHPDQGPIYPVDPAHPDNALPPIEGVEPPPVDPPPGTVWPPLPPGTPEGKAIALVAISGVGYRYVVITVSPPMVDNTLPGGETAEPKGRRAR